jgi:hypothetical protein
MLMGCGHGCCVFASCAGLVCPYVCCEAACPRVPCDSKITRPLESTDADILVEAILQGLAGQRTSLVFHLSCRNAAVSRETMCVKGEKEKSKGGQEGGFSGRENLDSAATSRQLCDPPERTWMA